MTEGKPFLEVLASAVHEDYRFPVLEIFAFLYTVATFVFTNASLTGIGTQFVKSEEILAFSLVYSLTDLPSFILLLFIVRNIAFGLGSDLEKGVVQTYLSYPLKRRSFLTAKLLSSIGVAVTFCLGVQVFALYILAPLTVSSYGGIILVSFAAAQSYQLLVAGIVLLLTLLLKRGSFALVAGIVMHFAFGLLSTLALFISVAMDSNLVYKALAVVNPVLALRQHYWSSPEYLSQSFFTAGDLWSPTFTESLFYVAAGYILVFFVFVAGYLYFERRLEP
ncbi:MAG: hypothetical protein NWF14_08440 [Candidatus Bathyarchaeota archaeon]|nr:hypothetical protein [Candidatus Bathyarchaeota archaeon]